MAIVPVEDRDTKAVTPVRSRGLVLVFAAVCAGASALLILSGADSALSRQVIMFMQATRTLSVTVAGIANLYEVKGVTAAAVLWWLWFRRGGDNVIDQRVSSAAVFLVTVAAIAVGRVTANFLPFRPRPASDPALVGEFARTDEFFQDWSSFPSDHALLFGAFAAAVTHLAPRLGWILLTFHTLFVVSLPRLLTGRHYLSDILAGLALGAALGWLLLPVMMRWTAASWVRVPESWKRPGIGYAAMFLMTFELATNFDGARKVLSHLASLLD